MITSLIFTGYLKQKKQEFEQQQEIVILINFRF
jgi:hypothetical protein